MYNVTKDFYFEGRWGYMFKNDTSLKLFASTTAPPTSAAVATSSDAMPRECSSLTSKSLNDEHDEPFDPDATISLSLPLSSIKRQGQF